MPQLLTEHRSRCRLRVAIVGSGSAARYATDELITRAAAEVDVFERLSIPDEAFQLGGARDCRRTEPIGANRTGGNPNAFCRSDLHYLTNIEVGTHISHKMMTGFYHAVIYAVGAAPDANLDVPGENYPGTHSASEFLAWCAGHPDYRDREVDLSGDRAVIVGNNSIAIHIARVLTAGPDQQSQTHIADHVRESLRCSHIREVVVLGQRGPAQAPYSPIEFLALGSLDGVDIVVNEQDLDLDLASRVPLDRAKLAPAAVLKLALAREFTQRPRNLRPRRIVFRYSTSPVRVQGPSRTAAIVVTRGEASFGTGPQIQAQRTESIETSLLVHSVGYQAPRIPGLPFDPTRGIVPNDQGRVILATGKLLRGVYVTGWIKQGPRGTIPDIRSCTHETVGNLLADYAARRLSPPRRSRFELHRTLRAQRPALLEWAVPMGARRLEINALT